MKKKFQKLFIATYTHKVNGKRAKAAGPAQPMLDFFCNRVEELCLLEQPSPMMEKHLPTIEIYKKRVFEKKEIMPLLFLPIAFLTEKRRNKGGTSIRLKIRDIVSVFYFIFKFPKRYDLFIGMESINAVCGIILRKMGIVKEVVYYLFDFTPRRYHNKFMNRVFLWLDKFATYHSDFVWNISPAYTVARIQELGYNEEKMAKQITVPFGVDVHNIEVLPYGKINKNTVIFSGSIGVENGPELFLDSIPMVLSIIPGAKFKFVGDGPQLSYLKDKAQKLNLQNKIEFTGFIIDPKIIEKHLCSSMVGVAPYPDMVDSTKKYGDVMKIREYLASGLPVITTSIPPISKSIDRNGAGIIIKYEAQCLAQAIVKLLQNENFYLECRQQAINMAKKNTWVNNYSNALHEMGFLN